MKNFLFLLFPILLWAGRLDSLVLNEVLTSGYTPSTIGFSLVEWGDTAATAELNSNVPFIPASVQKLFTGAAAMEKLSPLHDFRTEIYVDSQSGSIENGVGNIYIKGHGDPGFTAEQLWLMVYHLKMEGISSLKDTLFIDNSYFDSVSIGPGFGDMMSSRAYMAPVAPLSVNFNALAVHVRPTTPGKPAEISYLPPQFGQLSKGEVATIDDTAPSKLDIATFHNGTESVVSLKGTINKSDESRTIYRKVWDPVRGFAGSFIAACEQVGISCSLTVAERKVPAGFEKPFYSFSSLPLQRHIQNMFKYSNNFIAEMIFRSISAESPNHTGSWNDGAKVVSEWWKSLDTKRTPAPIIVNGSGMGSGNRSTPSAVIDVLSEALTKPRWSSEFISALPVAGEDGTLSSRFEKSPLKGIMRAKTGTLNNQGVSNLAGYIFKDSKTYLFVFFVNNTEKGQYSHWQLHEKVLTALYNEL